MSALAHAYNLVGRLVPGLVAARWRAAARAAGLDRPVFILSFDCDTEKDIAVGRDVFQRLQDRGITPVYAVPGALLEHGSDFYRLLAEAGCEFLNHGQAEHCRLTPEGRYESTFFYDKLPRDAVRADIIAGHETLKRILGITARGFRTPHFGSFQAPQELAFLHRILRELGYRFSTSTGPLWGLRHGILRNVGDIVEIPLTGCREWPATILDSWSFRFAGGRLTERDYLRQIAGFKCLMDEGEPIFVNLYADPSQVYDWPEFFEGIGGLSRYCLPSYERLLEMTHR